MSDTVQVGLRDVDRLLVLFELRHALGCPAPLVSLDDAGQVTVVVIPERP